MSTHIAASQALAQADLLQLLADLIGGPAESLPTHEEVSHLVPAAGLRDLKVDDLLALAAETSLDDWREANARLFEGATPCPLSQTAYIRRDKGAILADISGFYHAFGFELRPGRDDKCDHILAELEFTAMLLSMSALAGDDDHRAIALDALKSFATDHLSDWLALFCARLASISLLPLHQSLAHTLLQTWNAIASHHDFPIAQAPTSFALPQLDEEPATQHALWDCNPNS